MAEISKRLLAWVRKLLPKQKSQGDFAVQLGQAKGPVTIVNNHHVYHVNQTSERSRPSQSIANDEQRIVLRMMRDELVEQEVLKFMNRNFKTQRVISLTPHELFRVRRYAEVVRDRKVNAAEMPPPNDSIKS